MINVMNSKKEILKSESFFKSVNIKTREIMFDNRLKNEGGKIRKEIRWKLTDELVYCEVVYHLQGPIENILKYKLDEKDYKVVIHSGNCEL
jgi:hypothetical protein